MKPSARLNAALAAAALLLDAALAATTTSGRFSILAMNVAGLPEILNDNGVPGDKETNAATIGSKFAEYGYDVIQVQEDFNYHAHIYRTDNHPYRTPTSGGVPIGSGLNTLSNFNWVDFRRIKWRRCSDITAADCLTPKGFTFMRVAIAGPADNSTAVYVDFYNVHTDAGQTAIDYWARQDNVNQVAEYISEWSTGNAVLVFGDLNSRYSNADDTAIRALLATSENPSSAGMTDPWIELQHGGVIPTVENACGNPAADNACEIVDKVFYRSSPLVALQAETFRYDTARFLQADGSILTDHNPVFVDLSWSAGSSLRQSDFFGGPHGAWFSDVPALAGISQRKAAALTFRGGSRLDSVGVTLADGAVFKHGGTGGAEMSLELGATEYWTEAELCRGEKSDKVRSFYIQAATSSGRTLAAGTRTADCATFTAPDGWQIVGFVGQDGDEMDQLAFVYAPQ